MRLRTQDVTWQEIDGELVILDLARSTYLTTNGSGAFLAKRLTDEVSEDELAAALAAEYGIAAEDALADVREFVGSLAELELLERP